MKFKIAIFISGIFLISACSHSLYIPSNSDAALNETLTKGRQLYVDNCGKCHSLHAPSQFNAAQWQNNLDNMQERANINNDQKSLILAYLTSEPKS